MKLSFKIFIATLLPFLVIAAAYHYLANTLFSDYLTNNYRQQAGEQLYHLEDDILHILTEDENELRTLVKREPPDQKNQEQTKRTLSDFLYHDDSLVQVSVLTTNGREWLRLSKNQDLTNSSTPNNLFYTPIYQKPMLEMEPYLDFLKIESGFALPFFDLSIPFKNRQTGKIAGVLWFRSYSQSAQDILEKYLPTAGKIMLIRSENGEVILQADDTRQDFSSPERQAIRKISSDNRENGWLEIHQATFVYRKFTHNDLDMTLIYYQPHRNIYYLADQLKRYNLQLAVVGVALFILASFILIRTTISPLTRITGQITKLSYRYRPESAEQSERAEEQTADEIKQLLESFSLLKKRLSVYRNDMETEIRTRKQTEIELRDIQEKLEERIKERTQALEKTHAQLLHAEKLATSGSMAASIAHEFGNPLCGIKAVLDSVAQQDALPAEKAQMVNMALDECTRMNSLMQSLKDFNRPSSGEKTLTNLHLLIDDTIIFARQKLARKNIEVEREYDPLVPPIMVVSDQIKQVILNLINNSIDACDKGGVISIRTKGGEDSITLIFGDNGQGIKQNDLSRIFDPFFTSKPVVMGTGLGLSVSYGIIRRHDGSITVNSEVGEGATFTIVLPIRSDTGEE